MSYYGRTANEHVDVTMALVVEGIPTVFTERSIATTAPASWNGGTQAACITRVEEGEASLDLTERRETAATLDVDILDDGSLTTLFASASRRATFAIASATSSAATIAVDSTAGMVAGQAIYIGSETIVIGTVASGQFLTGCTRGAYGSKAAAIFADASDGDSVYLRPPSWRGRRAKLYGWGATETLLGTYILDDAPVQQGDQSWSLRFATVAQEYFERVIGLGLRSVGASRVSVITTTTISVIVEDAKAFRIGTNFPTYAIFEYDDGASIYRVESVDTVNNVIGVSVQPFFETPHILTGVGAFTRAPVTVRPLAVFGGRGAMLNVLLSSEGQNTGVHGWDRLPGRVSASTYDAGWRMGAAFDPSEVSISEFETQPETESTFVVSKERKLTDMLREWTLLTNTAIVTTVDGKIRPISLSPPRLSNTTTIGASSIIPDGAVSVLADENNVYPLIEIKAGYDPINDSYVDSFFALNGDLAKRYPRATGKLSVEISSIGVAGKYPSNVSRPPWTNPVSMRPDAMIPFVDALMKPSTTGRRIVSISLSQEHLALRLGDVVTFGNDLPSGFAVPDMRGGTILGASGRIISRRPRYDQARVDVKIELFDRRLHVCPSTLITGIAGNTITLAVGNVENSIANPAEHYIVGSEVLIVDRSQGGGAGAPWLAVVTAIPSGTQLTLDAVPTLVSNGWTIAALDTVTLVPGGSGTSTSGYSGLEAAYVVSPSNANLSRWG
jgi:hypothetical protein